MNGNHPSYITTEESALLQNLSVTNPETPRRSGSSCIVLSWRYPLMLGVSIALALYVGTKANWFSSRSALFTTPHDAQSDGAAPFPRDFVWGVATSSYQIEGATQLGGRGETIWDAFVRVPGKILDGSTGDVADDHYHLYQQDVVLMKSLNVKAYRFSIAWSRILPTGRGPVNEAGLRFYDRLIEDLLNQGIEPWITLFHWDLPLALQTDYEGWLDARTADCFVEYARVIFQNFSPKVKRFITLNEPWTYAVNGHGSGIHAPGRTNHPKTEPYLVAHNFLLAHARVAKLYKAEFAGADGRIGISNCGDFRYPKNEHSARDQEAASRAMLFQWGWFVEPLVFGDYPAVMRERLGERLPHFSTAERKDLIGSADFFGLNYYSSMLASNPDSEANFGGYWADIHVDFV
jgi:beta-glucosidase/6-phospho-beta-glucosidase/beta-galactosidase